MLDSWQVSANRVKGEMGLTADIWCASDMASVLAFRESLPLNQSDITGDLSSTCRDFSAETLRNLAVNTDRGSKPATTLVAKSITHTHLIINVTHVHGGVVCHQRHAGAVLPSNHIDRLLSVKAAADYINPDLHLSGQLCHAMEDNTALVFPSRSTCMHGGMHACPGNVVAGCLLMVMYGQGPDHSVCQRKLAFTDMMQLAWQAVLTNK
jgi:hypothetical protein